MILHRNLKGFLLSPVSLQRFKGYICSAFQNKPVQRRNKEIKKIHCIPYEGKMPKNEWENDDSDFLRALY